MIKIKSFILDETNWLEVIWVNDDEQVHCESYSGHPEHIQMLRDKAAELGTSLDEYEELITKTQSEFIMPTEAELLAYEQEQKIAEARAYLQATDYVAVKYNDEVTVTGSTTKTAFLAKYADVYAKRAEARAIVSGGE